MAKWKVGDLVLVETKVIVSIDNGKPLYKKYPAEIVAINFSTYSVKDLHDKIVDEVPPEQIYCRYIG